MDKETAQLAWKYLSRVPLGTVQSGTTIIEVAELHRVLAALKAIFEAPVEPPEGVEEAK